MTIRSPALRVGREKFGIDRYDPSLALYLPLWYEGLQPSNFYSMDINHHACTITGTDWNYQGRTFVAANQDKIEKATGVSGIGGQTGMSISGWVKRGATGAHHGIYALGSTAVFKYQLLFIRNTDKIEADFGNDADTAQRTFRTTDSFTDTTNFNHIVATYDAGTIVIYVNGVSWAGATGGTYTGAVCSPTTLLDVGAASGNSFWFNGIIGEVSVCNRAWTLAEVLRHYQATKWRYQ